MEQQTPVLVLVTMQRSCARLIRFGADEALKRHQPLHVVHVAPLGEKQNAPDTDTLNYLYALAGEAGATMCVLRSDVAVNAMAHYAKENNISLVYLGDGENAPGIARTLCELVPGVQVRMMEDQENHVL